MSKNSKKDVYEVMNRHVEACKKAFAEACRQMMLAVALVAPASAKPAPKRQAAKKDGAGKPAQKPQAGKAEPGKQKAEKPQAESGKQKAEKPKPPLTPHTRMPKSVRLTPHEITLNLGSFSIKELAENDAKELLGYPGVFWYRQSVFPDPRRYGVQPSCEAARVVRRQDGKFATSPWTVSTTIHVAGDSRKCDSWGMAVYSRNKDAQE